MNLTQYGPSSLLSEDSAPPPIGLYNKESNEMIPLKFIDVLIEITENQAKVSLKHHYHNLSNKIIDTSFNFPKTPNAVFHSLVVNSGKVEKVAIIEESKKAQARFKESVDKGETAIIADVGHSFLSPTVVTAKIGNILPNEEICLTFTYVEKLYVGMNRYYKFILPATMTPRYVPGKDFETLLKGVVESVLEDQINTKKLENLNDSYDDYIKNSKIVYLKGEQAYAYTWNVRVIINSSTCISNVRIRSNHYVNIDYSEDLKKAYVCLDLTRNKLPKSDFVLKFENLELHKPSLKIYRHPEYKEDYTTCIRFNPFHIFSDLQSKESLLTTKQDSIENFKGAFVFFIDRSYSMDGERIKMAKKALKIFLKSINAGCLFNVFSFGSKFETIFDTFMEVDDINIEKATYFVNLFDADMGGTELLNAISTAIYDQISKIKVDIPIRAFILTDGAVSNTKEILNLIQLSVQSNKNLRFYSLGVGNGCSYDLVQGIADYGGGKFEFASSDCLISEKTIYLLESSMKPCLTNFSINVNYPEVNSQIEENSTLISKGNKMNYLLDEDIEILSKFTLNKEKIFTPFLNFILSYQLPNLKEIFQVKFRVSLDDKDKDIEENDIFHKVWANEFCNGKNENINSIETALRYGILTKGTSLICVVKENSNISSQDLREKIKIDIKNQIPADYVMELYVTTLIGKTLTIFATPDCTIEEFKQKVK